MLVLVLTADSLAPVAGIIQIPLKYLVLPDILNVHLWPRQENPHQEYVSRSWEKITYHGGSIIDRVDTAEQTTLASYTVRPG